MFESLAVASYSPAHSANLSGGNPHPFDRQPTKAEVFSLLLLGDLVEAELDGGLTLEQRNQHGELAALGLDFVDRSGKPSERAFFDDDGFANYYLTPF